MSSSNDNNNNNTSNDTDTDVPVDWDDPEISMTIIEREVIRVKPEKQLVKTIKKISNN